MAGPDYTSLSYPTATAWATTLVLLEFLNTFEEGGPPPQKIAKKALHSFEEGGGMEALRAIY